MKILGPRLINNDKYLLYIDSTAMDPTQSRKRKLSAALEDTSITKPKISNDDGGDDVSSTLVTSRDSSARKPGGKRKRKPKVIEENLGSDYIPTEHDVICARGKDAQNHPGNIEFRSIISSFLEEYRHTQTKKEKTTIVCKVIERVRANGRFVRLHGSGSWCETGDDFAREKIGQCFRDRLHTEYRSSSKAKISRRKDDTTPHQQSTVKPMDFDEYMASREPEVPQPTVSARQPDLPRQLSDIGGRFEQQLLQQQQQQQQQQQHAYTSSEPKRCNFQGLADVYFGDASSRAQQSSSMPAGNRQHHLDLLGSLSQASRDNLSTMRNTFNPRMDYPMRMPDSFVGHMTFPQSNMNSFPTFSPNMYMRDRHLSGMGCFGSDSGVDPFDPQQMFAGTSLPQTLDQQKMSNFGMNLAMSKGYGSMQEAMWQTRGQRKPPPMPAGMFNPDPLDISVSPGEVMSSPSVKETVVAAEAMASEALDSSDQSSRIPDDEPLPLD